MGESERSRRLARWLSASRIDSVAIRRGPATLPAPSAQGAHPELDAGAALNSTWRCETVGPDRGGGCWSCGSVGRWRLAAVSAARCGQGQDGVLPRHGCGRLLSPGGGGVQGWENKRGGPTDPAALLPPIRDRDEQLARRRRCRDVRRSSAEAGRGGRRARIGASLRALAMGGRYLMSAC